MSVSYETLFDPFSPAEGPPPQEILPFMRWMLRGAGPAVWLLALVSLCLGIAEALSAWLIGWVVDAADEATRSGFFATHWLTLLGIGLFFLFGRPGLMIASSGLTSRALQPGLFHLGVWRLHRHTLGQALSFFEDDYAGRISQKQMQTANSLTSAVTEFLNAITYGFSAILGAALVLGGADWRLAAALGLWFMAYVVLISRFLPRIRLRSRRRADARSGLSGQLVDSISHMETVKIFAHSGREEEAARNALARFRHEALAFGRTVWAFRALLALLSGVLPVLLIGLALWLWQIGAATAGDIAMAGVLSTRLSHMSGWISFTAMNVFSDLGVVEDGMRTLSPPHALPDRPNAVAPVRAEGDIRFENVTFRYGREDGGGLKGVNFGIRAGEKVALVGPSGAGKSTAVSLLLRLYEVEGGRVALDGRDVRDLEQDWLRRQIATVTQEPALFNRSALENILYGRPEAGREAAIAAAKRASAHEFIEELRDPWGRTGYDAHLGERGVKLSGGQRQRIALARAVLKDAPVLVLDEATSALDSEVEAEIQDALAELMEGKTVMAIAHRLSTIQQMDRIIVLDGGRVVEEGNHPTLLKAGGLYARLWARQSGGFLGGDLARSA